MSSTYAEPLDPARWVCWTSSHRSVRSTAPFDEKQELLLRISRLISRAEGERLRVLAASDDIAEVSGDRSTATWLATKTREAHGTVRRHVALAASLGSRWTRTADALGAGDLNLAQARVIVEALDALPDDLGDDLVVKAEAYLVEQAQVFGPRELRHLGRGVLEHLAPEIADEAEYQRLLAEETRAQAATRLDLRPRGDGSTDLHARVPDHVANRLRTYLDAYTSPRRTPLGEVDALPVSRRRGEAFVAFLENVPDAGLPTHGGTTTSVMVTLDLDTLLTGLGTATTSTGDRITAEQARRLACQARISPLSSAGRVRSSTSDDPPGCSHRPSAKHSQSATRSAPSTDARSPPPGAKPTTGDNTGPEAAAPTSPTASCCARSTTTARTTPPGSLTTTPTGRRPSTAGRERAFRAAVCRATHHTKRPTKPRKTTKRTESSTAPTPNTVTP